MQSEEGARMGFTGKQVIHPSQISVVQTAFAPSPERMEWATELIAAFEAHQQSGKVRFGEQKQQNQLRCQFSTRFFSSDCGPKGIFTIYPSNIHI